MNDKIIADSCCDITPQLRERLGVMMVPLILRLGEKEFKDDDSLDIRDFMSQVKSSPEPAGSASPPPIVFQEAIESAGSSFVVTVSSRLSGSYSSAVMGQAFAEERGETDTYVFDSKSASAGELLVVIKIRELLQRGMAKEHIIQTVNRFIESMKTYFVLERYDILLKNGRLSKITEKIISVLNIKLVMGSDGDGNIKLHAKARGTNQMIEKLLSFIRNSGRETDGENLVISHCNNPGLASQLADAVKRQFHFKEIFIVPTGGLCSLYANDKGIIMAF